MILYESSHIYCVRAPNMHKHLSPITEYNVFYMLPNKVSDVEITQFRDAVWEYYHSHQRSMPWREDPTAYNVLVSELMLQQTQVNRVLPKFEAFVSRFPDFAALAEAPLGDVLIAWSGLGYNRRAKFLWQAARAVVEDFGGKLPDTLEDLVTLPGIGPNTAGAILAYAYNTPTVFIETNIRTVLLHHFFADTEEKVSDVLLRNIAGQVLDREHPREWYWAMMDYGTHLKKTAGGRLDQSAAYRKQSKLEGSPRQMRGRIIRSLTEGPLSRIALETSVGADARFVPALDALLREGLIEAHRDGYRLTLAPNTR